LRDTGPIARLALIAAVLVVVLFPGQASAQFGPFPAPSEEYGPGISVTGVGFAPLEQRDRATASAVGDARRRAEAIASQTGVSLGGISSVESDTPFAPRPTCARSTRGRCAPLEAVTVEVTFEISGGPTSDEGAREVSGTGVAVAPVEAARLTSPAIRHALRAARLAASPLAAEAASTNAKSAAAGSGVTLGPLFSVVEVTNPFGYGYEPLLGSFGPGQFCGLVRRVTLERDPETGERHVVRHKRKRRCFKQSRVTVRIEATYLAG
jgi:hypothetical protein